MSFLKVLGNSKNRLVEFFLEDQVEEQEVVVPKEEVITSQQQVVKKRIKVANGPDITYSEPVFEHTSSKPSVQKTQKSTSQKHVKQNSPVFHVISQKEFFIRTFNISSFEDVKRGAAALKFGKLIVLNFEKIDFQEQYGFCDFLNGVCYALGGSAMRITSTIVIYSPAGISLQRAE